MDHSSALLANLTKLHFQGAHTRLRGDGHQHCRPHGFQEPLTAAGDNPEGAVASVPDSAAHLLVLAMPRLLKSPQQRTFTQRQQIHPHDGTA